MRLSLMMILSLLLATIATADQPGTPVDTPTNVQGFCAYITAEGMMPPAESRIDRKGRYVCKWYLRAPSTAQKGQSTPLGFCQWLTQPGMMPPVIGRIDRKGRYVCKWYLRVPIGGVP